MHRWSWTTQRCILDPPDKDKILEVFSELEFRNLTGPRAWDGDGHARMNQGPARRTTSRRNADQVDLFGTSVDADGNVELTEMATIETVAASLLPRGRNEALYMLAAQLKKQPRFCFDTETTSTDERTAELVGLAFSWKAHEGHYVPVPADRGRSATHRGHLQAGAGG